MVSGFPFGGRRKIQFNEVLARKGPFSTQFRPLRNQDAVAAEATKNAIKFTQRVEKGRYGTFLFWPNEYFLKGRDPKLPISLLDYTPPPTASKN